MSESRYKKIKDLKFNSYFIDCPVEIEKGALLLDNELNLVLLQLRLLNIGTNIVSSVFVSVDCFDDAEDLIPQTNSVEHAYLDLEAENKTSFGEKKPILLDQSIRNVKVTITKVTIKDGKVWRNNDAQEFISPKQESIEILGTDLLDQLNREANLLSISQRDKIQLIPKQIEGMWLCSCGRANRNDSEICCRCGLQKTWIFQNTEMSYLKAKLSEYNERISIASEKQKLLDEELARNQIKKDLLLNEIKVKENTEKTRRSKKYKIIVGLSLLSITIMALLWKSILEPNINYNKGIALYESGNYSVAAEVFQGLGDYKDARVWGEKAELDKNYSLANDSIKNGKYEVAIKLLTSLNGYKDSNDIKDNITYEYAKELIDKKWFYEAKEYLLKIKDKFDVNKYLDSNYFKIEGDWAEHDGTNYIEKFRNYGKGIFYRSDAIYRNVYYKWSLEEDFVLYEVDINNPVYTIGQNRRYKILEVENTPGGNLILEWIDKRGYKSMLVYDFVSK